MDRLRWGIIGPGGIAQKFAAALAQSRTGRLVAIATRDASRPGLAEGFPGVRIVSGYDALLADNEIDAVYVATPHSHHAEWGIKAALAGKHVLVEKPMATSAADAARMFEAARVSGTFMAEAFMYRFHPMTAKIGELIAAGVIGEVRIVQSSFGLQMEEFRPGHRLYSPELAGGGILDVGCYPVSMVRHIAGLAAGKPFLDPVTFQGAVHLSPEGVDDWASATLSFENGIIGQVACAIGVALDNVLRLHGETGSLEIADFWSASGGRNGDAGRIDIVREDQPRETIVTEGPSKLYVHEADAVGAAIMAAQTELRSPGPSWADSLGNMVALDQWRAGFVVAKS